MTTDAHSTTRCPHCNGEVKAAAKICKHCTRPIASPAVPSVAPMGVPTGGGSPGPVLVALRSFLLQRGLLRREHIDLVFNAHPNVEAGVALGHLAAAGLITPAQAETLRGGFWQWQGQRAQSVLTTTVQRGLLTPAQAEAARAQYESMALQQTIGEFLSAHGLLTPAQAAEFGDARSAVERWELGAQWRSLPIALRGVLIAVPALATLAGLVVVVRGSPDVRVGTVMDGYGRGKATFTNRGRRDGALCGHVSVHCVRGSESSVSFCSGSVEPGGTRELDFRVPGMERIIPYNGNWRADCEHSFVPETRTD